MGQTGKEWVGQSVERVEDLSLLSGRGRYIDDLPLRPDTLHAAVLRSPHAHAKIRAIDTAAAAAASGVAAVVTGRDVTALSASPVVGAKAPIECWPIAVDRVRYVGQPVAVVVAADRYLAEDALELIEVDYEPPLPVVDPLDALDPKLPPLHEGLGSNIASDRSFRYGDPERAFAQASRRISVSVGYPRNSCTPIETYGVIAEYDAVKILTRR
jgi:2-furoyl-CoA dehydrogenase large subunit